jgi:hypothetical protein
VARRIYAPYVRERNEARMVAEKASGRLARADSLLRPQSHARRLEVALRKGTYVTVPAEPDAGLLRTTVREAGSR